MKSRQDQDKEGAPGDRASATLATHTPPSEQEQATNMQERIGPQELRRWGETVRQRRRDLGLTLKQLADVTGISFGYLAKLERGEAGAVNPTRLVIDALRGALNIPPPGGEKLSRAALASWVSEESSPRGISQTTQQKMMRIMESSTEGADKAETAAWQRMEALLLICGRLNAAQLAAGLGCALFEVEETAQVLREQLVTHGIMLQEMNGEYQLASDAGLARELRAALVRIGAAPRQQTHLTHAQREVLALVIMHQPITRAGIERYRGVESDKPLSVLVEADLVAVLPTLTLHGARQYVSTLRVLEEAGYSTLEALHQAIRDGLPTLLPGHPDDFLTHEPAPQRGQEGR